MAATQPATLRQLIMRSDDHRALVVPESRVSLSYAALQRALDHAVGRLAALGVREGDRVALVAANGPALVIAFLAVVASGAAAAPLNPALGIAELTGELDDLGVSRLLTRAMDLPVPVKHRLRFVRSCSAPLPRILWQRYEAAIGVPLVEAYGMTEAAHQMASNPLPPGERWPGTVGRATGVEIAVLDDGWQPVPAGEKGEVSVRGPSVVDEYLDNPAATAAAFGYGWFRTGDVGKLSADGYLTLVGRLKELINRAGEKISPYEVEDVLLAHPAVAEAAAYPVPDAKYGEQVGVVVVLSGAATPRELAAHCAQYLAAFKRPARVTILPEIPKGPTGKVQRRNLATLVDQ